MLPLLLCIGIVLLDQFTKAWIRQSFLLGELREVIPHFMNLTHLRNPGAAWGMFGGQSALLSLLSIIVLVVMVLYRKTFLNDTLAHRIALGLLAGGIIGNLIDRVKFGAVTDFLDFYVGSRHWPAFNVADSAICIGVGIYMITVWMDEVRRVRESKQKACDTPAA